MHTRGCPAAAGLPRAARHTAAVTPSPPSDWEAVAKVRRARCAFPPAAGLPRSSGGQRAKNVTVVIGRIIWHLFTLRLPFAGPPGEVGVRYVAGMPQRRRSCGPQSADRACSCRCSTDGSDG